MYRGRDYRGVCIVVPLGIACCSFLTSGTIAYADNRVTSGMHVVGVDRAAPNQYFSVVESRGQGINWEHFQAVLTEGSREKQATPAKQLWESLPEPGRDVIFDKKMLARIANAPKIRPFHQKKMFGAHFQQGGRRPPRSTQPARFL